jgi:phosphatidylserine decarboxylase
VARDSTAWISVPLAATALALALGRWYAFVLAFIFSGFIIFFHRDPERHPAGDGMISPADGRVVEAENGHVAIFMSPLNVHVNRAPLDGIVRKSDFRMGGHLPAFLSGASKNQRNSFQIETKDGAIDLVQITGAFVRRIIPYVGESDIIRRGERIGMIRFGSRVEVTVPEGYILLISAGESVRAGETVIAVKVP